MEPSVVATRCGRYRSLFDRRSGLLARYNDNFLAPSPEILEICLVGEDGDYFDMGALRRLLEQAPLCRQVMLVGESERHPALPAILRTIRNHGVIPSVVVSNPDPDNSLLDALNRFAGFVAIDCGFSQAQLELVRTFRNSGIRVCLNLPVADSTLSWLASSLERGTFEHLIHSVTLAGRSRSGPTTQATGLKHGPEMERLIETVSHSHSYRIGSDARITPFLVGGHIGHPTTIPRCEAGRCGLFVDHDLTVRPCSLLENTIVGSLEDSSLEKIWKSSSLTTFRRSLVQPHTPCAKGSVPTDPEPVPKATELHDVELRFGFASCSLCDRALLPLSRSQMLHILAAVNDWKALRFFTTNDEEIPTQVAASWSSLEYFLSLPPLWGQDLARLHEQLVAGTFEGQEEL